MPTRFRFGVQLTNLRDRSSITTSARQAEDLGYEDLFSFDHLGDVDPIVPLLVAAEATTSLRMGPLVLNNEFHNPGLLARTAATVDRLTGGRLILGIGTGYARSEHEALGITYADPGTRVDRLRESLHALHSLLDRHSVEFTGRYHHLAIRDLGIRPVQARVPLLVGGYGKRLIEAAAEFADIVQFTGLTHAADGTPQPGGFALEALSERARWLTAVAGHRNQVIERSILVQSCVIDERADEARELASRRLGLAREVIETTPFLLIGALSEIVERLQSLRDSLGISHVVVREAVNFAPVVAALAGQQ